ncbi:hypothetical protein EKH77_26370 [Streptomyces luteoverticillatus]|uniref:Uncharacterized protein n=1 Tax=Streptomyces luteoverticillatus TaxID=66425 RepID=A0A3S9PPI5_STRLT|nr:hypothetical protein [Streptomyces luteoverticillatus]AZQ74270.1 hypothetical protein EKH77_26370 [Streptomyces luteoverticillatus]
MTISLPHTSGGAPGAPPCSQCALFARAKAGAVERSDPMALAQYEAAEKAHWARAHPEHPVNSL